MRGTLVKRSKGSWSIVFDVGRDAETGRRRQKWVSVKGSKREAERKLAELIHELDTGSFVNPAKITLGEFLERWLKDYVWPNLSPETAQGYDTICRKHLIPALGNLRLTQLRPETIQSYYSQKLAAGRRDGKGGGLSPRTVYHHHQAIHTALQNALKWKLLARNPADAVDPPKYRRKEMQTFDAEGMEAFLESIRESEYYALFYSALFTGCRRSELLALRWTDVDLDLGHFSINRSLHHLENGTFVFLPPKTEKSRRLVALPPSASIVLRKHREQQRAERILLGIPVSDEDLVFAHSDGSPLLPHSITHAWTRLAKKAGFGDIRLHDARHTHATIMLTQGIHPKVVQERLGHSSIAMTLDLYSHVAPTIQEAAARRFDEGLARPTRTEARERVSSG